MRDSLTELRATPYFKSNLDKYANCIIDVISYVIDNYNNIDKNISRDVTSLIWRATKYLRGSVSAEIPYEVEYTLTIALKDWLSEECAITTALLDDRDYHFYPLDTWKTIKVLLPDYSGQNFDVLLVQMGLPRIYKHKPLYYVPLYHELGHFIDQHFGITEATLLHLPPIIPSGALPQDTKSMLNTVKRHRAEVFADLFSSCYVGHEGYKFLQEIAPGEPPSPTHPATDLRVKITQDFLTNTSNEIVDLYQNTLHVRGMNSLSIKYSSPNISETFNNLRPYEINSDTEAHGIFEAAWSVFRDAAQSSSSPWNDIEEKDISRIINDLTEKSIRNRVIVEKWNNETS